MKTDNLIIGNAYTWIDEDGQPRTAIFDGHRLAADRQIGYRFRVRTYTRRTVVLTAPQVLNSVFRFSITPDH